MKNILLLIAILYSFQAFSQDSSVVIHKDPRIELLVKKQEQINEYTTRNARRTAKGYRLLIISTNSRDEAIAAKTKVYTNFPELKAYMWHQSPYFKVKAGNFKDRKEADDFRKRMAPFFPKGVYIMNDTIEISLDSDDDDN